MKSNKPHPPNPNPNRNPSAASRKPPRPYRKPPTPELKYYGFHACLKLWQSRPEDVVRVYIEQKRVKEATPLLRWCASKNKAYHIISAEELSKVTDSIHHEGLCLLAREQPPIDFPAMLDHLRSHTQPTCLLYLDGVQNPHNIGSIMRVCAHFGVAYIMGEKTLLPKVSPSTYRIAQGGAEHVRLVPLDHIKQSFEKLKQLGFVAVASSSHGGKSLYEHRFSPKTVMVMGSESEGVKNKLLEAAKETLLIPGSGFVESLNVSVATGLFLGEYYRQAGLKT